MEGTRPNSIVKKMVAQRPMSVALRVPILRMSDGAMNEVMLMPIGYAAMTNAVPSAVRPSLFSATGKKPARNADHVAHEQNARAADKEADALRPARDVPGPRRLN